MKCSHLFKICDEQQTASSKNNAPGQPPAIVDGSTISCTFQRQKCNSKYVESKQTQKCKNYSMKIEKRETLVYYIQDDSSE